MVEKEIEKPRSEWNKDDKKRAQPNFRVKNLITSALSYNEFFRFQIVNPPKKCGIRLE
jgi:hypothetical protein